MDHRGSTHTIAIHLKALLNRSTLRHTAEESRLSWSPRAPRHRSTSRGVQRRSRHACHSSAPTQCHRRTAPASNATPPDPRSSRRSPRRASPLGVAHASRTPAGRARAGESDTRSSHADALPNHMVGTSVLAVAGGAPTQRRPGPGRRHLGSDAPPWPPLPLAPWVPGPSITRSGARRLAGISGGRGRWTLLMP